MKLRRIFDVVYEQPEVSASLVSEHLNEEGNGAFFHTRLYKNSIYALASHLTKAGIKKGDIIITLSAGCVEWNIIDWAVMSLGAVHVALSPTLTAPQLNNILSETCAALLFVQHDFIFSTLHSCRYYQTHNIPVVVLKPITGHLSLPDIINQVVTPQDVEKVNAARAQVAEDDIALISYTSGTGDTLKGVIHNHKSIIEQVEVIAPMYRFDTVSSALSFLPINYMYERLLNYIYQYAGVPVFYADNTLSLSENLLKYKPGCSAMVPDSLNLLLNSNTGLNELKAFLRFLFCSGAPLKKDAFDKFSTANIDIFENYGSTETLIIALNSHAYFKAGATGKILFPERIKLHDGGELYYRSTFSGYLKNEALNHAKIDSAGYYATGDIVAIDGNEYLTIKGRATEVFKKATGVFINPADIEQKIAFFCNARYIVVYADSDNRLKAIIVPQQMQPGTAIAEGVKNYNMQAKTDHVIEGYKIIADDWSEATGELTGSRKLRRAFIIEKYS